MKKRWKKTKDEPGRRRRRRNKNGMIKFHAEWHGSEDG
jgi:hypothetical protein